MNGKAFGALIASAVAALITGVAFADQHEGDTKACYRKSCGESVKGHTGTCAGTKVADLKDEKSCSAAGGAWISEADAAKLKGM